MRRPNQLAVKDLSDGISWTRGEVSIADGGFVSFWLNGLPENRSALDMRVLLGDIPLADHLDWTDGTEWILPDQREGSTRSGPKDRTNFKWYIRGGSSEPQAVKDPVANGFHSRRLTSAAGKSIFPRNWRRRAGITASNCPDGSVHRRLHDHRAAETPLRAVPHSR